MRAPSLYLPALIGMPMAGLLWSLASLYAKSDLVASLDVGMAEAATTVTIGGLALMLALWVGFAAVTWAMVRALRGHLALIALVAMMSNAALPLWGAAPATALWLDGHLQGNAALAFVALTGVAIFLQMFAVRIAIALSWSMSRAAGALGLALLFVSSFVYLSI